MIERMAIGDIKVKQEGSHTRLNADVSDLVESFSRVGVLQPVLINSKNELVAGGRRYSAAQKLNLKEIPAIRLALDTVDEELAALDENLARVDLSELQEEEALLRRKVLYEEKYPDARPVRIRGGGRKTDADSALVGKTDSFAEATSKITGQPVRTIQQQIARAARSSPAVKAARNENVISKAQTDEIIKLPAEAQEAVLPVIRGFDVRRTRRLVNKVKHLGLCAALKEPDFIGSRSPEAGSSMLVRDAQRILNETSVTLSHNVFGAKESQALSGVISKVLVLFRNALNVQEVKSVDCFLIQDITALEVVLQEFRDRLAGETVSPQAVPPARTADAFVN